MDMTCAWTRDQATLQADANAQGVSVVEACCVCGGGAKEGKPVCRALSNRMITEMLAACAAVVGHPAQPPSLLHLPALAEPSSKAAR